MHERQEGDHLLSVGEVLDLEQVNTDDVIESGEPAAHQDGALLLVQIGLILDDLPGVSPAIILGIKVELEASIGGDHHINHLRLCLGPMQLYASLVDLCDIHVDFMSAGIINKAYVVLTQILLAQIMVGLEGLALVFLQDVLRVGSFAPLLIIYSLDVLLDR